MFVEGEFLDTVIGSPESRTEIVMLRPPDTGTRLEFSSFVRPDHEPGSSAAMANEVGLREVAFEADDLQAAVDGLAADGYGLVGGIGQYEHIWRMAYVRGPEGSSCPWPSGSADTPLDVGSCRRWRGRCRHRWSHRSLSGPLPPVRDGPLGVIEAARLAGYDP